MTNSMDMNTMLFQSMIFWRPPAFQEVMWQNAQLQQTLKGGAKPSCAPGMGSCPPINSDKTCQNLEATCAANAQHPKDPKVDYEAPCTEKILKLFGCDKAKQAAQEKPMEEPKEDKPKPLPIPKKKPPVEEEKEKEKEAPPPPPPPKKKPDLRPIGEQLTSEDSGSKITPGSAVDGVTQSMKGVQARKLEENTENSLQAKQSFYRDPHNKPEDNTGKVGLMNEEESLALMTAIGTDLQKSLSHKFSPESKNHQLEDDESKLNNHHKHHKQDNDMTDDITGNLHNKTSNGDSKVESKELTSYFQTLNGAQDSSEGKEISLTDKPALSNFFHNTDDSDTHLRETKEWHETKEVQERKRNTEKIYY